MDAPGPGLPFDGGPLLSPEPDRSGRSPLPPFTAAAQPSYAQRERDRLIEEDGGGQFGSQLPLPSQPLYERFEQQHLRGLLQDPSAGQAAQRSHRDGGNAQQQAGKAAQPAPAAAAAAAPAPQRARGITATCRPTHGSPSDQDGEIDAASLLAYLINRGDLDELVVEDDQGQPRLRDGAVVLQLDVMRLLNAEPLLGARWLTDPKEAVWRLMEELHSEGLSTSSCLRLWVRPTQVPLPCQPVDALLACLAHHSAVTHGSQPTANNGPGLAPPQQPPSPPSPPPPPRHGTLVCCYGVVLSASSLSRRPHSRVLVCTHCGTATEVLDERGMPQGGGCGCSAWAENQGALSAMAGGELLEDLSGRVMVDVQDLWLGALNAGLPPPPSSSGLLRGPGGGGCGGRHFVRLGALRVTCTDDLAGSAKVGDVVRVVGLARLIGPAGAGRSASATAATAVSSAAAGSIAAPLRSAAAAGAVAEVEALSLTAVSPLALWARPGGYCGGLVVGRSRQPLQLLCDLLTQLLGRPLEPLMKLAVLASAVSVPGPGGEGAGGDAGGGGGGGGGPGRNHECGGSVAARRTLGRGGGDGGASSGRPQLSLLVGSDTPGDPLLPRLLRALAALLSPHTAVLGGAAAAGSLTDDPLTPRLQSSASRSDVEGQAGAVAHGSVLLSVGNRGVVVVDAEQLTAKQKTQLCDLLGKPLVTLAPTRPELAVPVTATVWAAACRAAAADGGAAASAGSYGGGGGGRRGGRGGGGGPVPGSCRGSWSGLDDSRFDLVLEVPTDDDTAAAIALDPGSLDEGEPAAADGMDDSYMCDALRQHVAAAALLSPPPQLSDAALDVLMRYYVSVRQSGVQVAQSEVLRSLVKVATASARLHLRRQVLEAPDTVLAVLLMERTLSARFGDVYLGLGLPLSLLEGTGLVGAGEASFFGEDAMDVDRDAGEVGEGEGLDAALQSMKATLARCLRGFTPMDWQTSQM